MKLECNQVWEHISEYLDQQLTPEVREGIEKHLENCETCSATLDSTRNVLILTADHRTYDCLLYTSPSPRDYAASRMPSSA